jgi:hypothetical protein
LGGVRVLALALVAAWSLGVAPPFSSGAASGLFENPRLGYTLGIPPGWQASVRPADAVAVITSLPVPNRNDNPERIRMQQGGVYIWIGEYRDVRTSGVPRRPTRIQLGERQAYACGFGEGYMLYFTDHRRLIQAFVKLGPSTGKRTALAVLNSLRVTQ